MRTEDPADGLFRAHSRLGLAYQLRVHIGVALAVVPQSTWKLVDAKFVDGRKVGREELVERIVKGLAPFDIRWKGDTSLDPDALPPSLRIE